jgi:acyl-CoA thioester hydrolase
MIEDGAGRRTGWQIEPGFGATADIFQKPEKENPHLHYGKVIKTSSFTINHSVTATVSPHLTSIRVRYAETDQMGIVYYANYLVWMEVARVDYCRAIGFHYKNMELEDGVLLAVAESHCRYVSPARFDEEISISTTVPNVNRRFVSFDYEMTCDGRRVAMGQTRHVFLNRMLRPIRLPDKYAAMFGIA